MNAKSNLRIFNFFSSEEQIKTIDTLRIIYFITFLLSFMFTEFGLEIYPPFIYKNNINDFGIADSIGNVGGIVAQVFFMLATLNSTVKKGIRLIVFVVFGYILYEIIQPILPRGTFDWLDIYGTIIGAVICLLIFLLIKQFMHNKIFLTFWEDKKLTIDD